MSKIETAKRLWQTDKLSVLGPAFHKLQKKGLLNWMSDSLFLKCAFRLSMGYPLDLQNPKTFNEKLQWLKLYDYKTEYDKLVDKYEVKKYVTDTLGNEYVVPTYGIWNSVEEIDWDSMPNQFVIKTTHGSGGHDVCICRDKSTFNIEDCKKKLRISMSKNTYWYGRERPYKNLTPRIMAEKLLVDNIDVVGDYKVHNFNGVPKFLLVCRDRYSECGLTEDFFTNNWKHIDVMRPFHPNASKKIERPKELDLMIELSNRLSKGIPFVRSDFYVADSKVYFGELTFYPASGFVPFEPEEWDEKWGQKKQLGLKDYKFYCFNGEPKFLYVSQDLDNHTLARISFLTIDWQFAPFRRNDYEPLSELPEKPLLFDEMVIVAKQLSHNHKYLRVDLYEVNNKVYFSELTFYPASGFMPFNPRNWDEKVGDVLKI